MPAPARWVIPLLGLAFALAACGTDNGGDIDLTAPAIATFEVVGGEQFKIELTTQELVDHALGLINGEELAAIPVGTVVRNDPGVNAPWSWHIDPTTVEFADLIIELCGGLPSFVEAGAITSDQYCPWAATVISLEAS